MAVNVGKRQRAMADHRAQCPNFAAVDEGFGIGVRRVPIEMGGNGENGPGAAAHFYHRVRLGERAGHGLGGVDRLDAGFR